MRITKISYGATFPTMAFANEKFMVEYELNEGDSASEAMELARKFVNETYIKNNPHIFQDQETKVSDIANAVIENKQRPKDQIDAMVFDIQSVTELTVLKSYELLCKNNPKLQEAYQLKLKQLSNG